MTLNKKRAAPPAVPRAAEPREIPAYSVRDAAHYLLIPAATVRSWVQGAHYTISGGKRRFFRPVIELPNPKTPLLSFYNLAEAHVLRSLRTTHGVTLQHIRRALDYVREAYGWQRPLIQQGFQTNGVSLFVERLGELVDVGAQGQRILRGVLETHLERLEWEEKIAARLYPFTRSTDEDTPKTVFIDPRYGFGRPLLRRGKVPTAVIAERYKGGESVEELAQDYGCQKVDIEEAIRCELRLPAAA
jgi:uncharacterized protein (DUF433 family)